MKRHKGYSGVLFLFSILLTSLLIFGCSELPNSPEVLQNQDSPELVNRPECFSGDNGLTVDEDRIPEENINGSSVISAVLGGTVSYTVGNNNSGDFNVPPRSLRADAEITIGIKEIVHHNKTDLEFTFGPEGLVFARPATLTIPANAFNNDTIRQVEWYYFNPETGLYELVDKVTVKNGEVKIKVHHFSKYIGISQGGQ